MKRTTEEMFRQYVLTRRDLWENKYDLKETSFEERFTKRHLPNNLKYLDSLSQRMIRVMAKSKADIETKLMTCLVYRLVPNENLLSRKSLPDGTFDLKSVEKIGQTLDRYAKTRVAVNTHFKVYTPIMDLDSVSVDHREQYLKACVASFLYHLPDDLFEGWTMEAVYKYLMSKSITGVNDFIAYELASDFTYIPELGVRVSFIRAVPSRMNYRLKDLLKGNASVLNYNRFVNRTITWYNEQEFESGYERLICPHDVLHMVIGYYSAYTTYGRIYRRKTTSTHHIKGDFSTRSLLITESIVKAYAKRNKEIHSETDG